MVRKFFHISFFLGILTYSHAISALGSNFDFMCSASTLHLVRDNCIKHAALYSKCPTYDYETHLCTLWGGGSRGPLYAVSIPLLSSFADFRTPVSTENYKKKIYRYELEHEVISYAWEQWKDLDFILMIQEESLWEEFIFGDSGNSIGFCQINKLYGKELYEKYLGAKDWKERITICYNHYQKFSSNVGIVFHAWKTRMRNLPSFTFQ